MKKIIALLMTAMLCLALLSGCGGSTQSSTSDKNSESAENSVSKDSKVTAGDSTDEMSEAVSDTSTAADSEEAAAGTAGSTSEETAAADTIGRKGSADAMKAVIDKLGIGGPVEDKDNAMGMHLTTVKLDDDGDIYVQWDFDNEAMRSNLMIAWSKVTLVDPDDIHNTYQVFTRTEEDKISIPLKAGDMINVLDFVHIIRNDFETESDVYILYFDGSEGWAPDEVYTAPQVFIIGEGENGPEAYETTPRYAPEDMITAVRENTATAAE